MLKSLNSEVSEQNGYKIEVYNKNKTIMVPLNKVDIIKDYFSEQFSKFVDGIDQDIQKNPKQPQQCFGRKYLNMAKDQQEEADGFLKDTLTNFPEEDLTEIRRHFSVAKDRTKHKMVSSLFSNSWIKEWQKITNTGNDTNSYNSIFGQSTDLSGDEHTDQSDA